MKLTQGTFSFLPELTDEQIESQIEYCLGKGWAVSIEHTDDPHPRNTYWEMFGMPLFDARDAGDIVKKVQRCREAFPNRYVKVNAFDSTRGWEALRLSFIVARPQNEPGFTLQREEADGRRVRYTLRAYAADRPEAERYA